MNMGLARRKTFPGGLSSHCFCCIPREGDEALTCSGPHRKCFCLRRYSLPSPLLCFLHFRATCLPKGPSACHPPGLHWACACSGKGCWLTSPRPSLSMVHIVSSSPSITLHPLCQTRGPRISTYSMLCAGHLCSPYLPKTSLLALGQKAGCGVSGK